MGVQYTQRKRRAKKKKEQSFWLRYRRVWKWIGVAALVLFVLNGAIRIAFIVSPWPGSLLIRHAFEQNNTKVAAALAKHVPSGIFEVESRHYRPNDKDAYLDVFYPAHTTTQLPTVVWVHGGAWVAGNKNDIDNYMSILASYGFTTVSVNYSLAPEKQYPTPLLQLNDALGYIQTNARSLHIDPHHLALAGDSAGSQIVAQVANATTSPSYAKALSLQPKVSATSLKAMLLNCGAYDLNLPDYSGPFGKFLHTVLWAYSGTQDFLHDPKLKTASVVKYITARFPPTFITAGNVDPLLPQSTEFAKKLQSLGVPTSTLFYAPDHVPQLNHEYQFDLDTPDGQQALQQMVVFLRAHI